MKWEIKRGLFQDTLLDAVNGKKAVIRRRIGSYQVFDSFGKMRCRLELDKPLRIRFFGLCEGIAEMKLAESHSFFMPPKAETMEVHLEETVIFLCQTQNRNFILSENDAQIGTITRILQKRVQFDILDIFPADTVALLYALALFMLRADDIEIV